MPGSALRGYYAWPRYGFDAPLSKDITARLPEALASARTLLDLMATPEGRIWWRNHGRGLDVVFDLAPGSRSLQVLDEVLREKGVRLPA